MKHSIEFFEKYEFENSIILINVYKLSLWDY